MKRVGGTTWPIVVGAIAVIALAVVLLLDDDVHSEASSRQQGGTSAPVASSIAAKKKRGVVSPKPARPEQNPPTPANGRAQETPHARAVEESEFTPAEQKTVDAIQDALDNEDLKKVAAQLKDAAASTNAAVRAKAVEALQWFGEKALPELAPFMADEDDDVRTSAIDTWTMGLSQMETGDNKAKTVRMGLTVVTDRGQLESMVMQVDDLTDFQKLDVLTKVIEGDNKTAAEVAREHYKFWTEEDYTDLAAAQKWLDAKAAEESESDSH